MTMSKIMTLKIGSLTFMALCFASAIVCLYYVYLVEGNDFTDRLDALRLRSSQWQLDTYRLVVSSLPAFCLAYGVDKSGNFTRFGVISLALIAVTFLVSTVASVLIEPHSMSPTSMALATSISRLSSTLSTYSLALGLAVIGISRIEKAP